MNLPRCRWAKGELLQRYHDQEWGAPVHDDAKLYEMLFLEAFQAGLSWQVVLSKREHFRNAFDQFNPQKIAAYDHARIDELMADAGIIRCRRKIEAAVVNARCFLAIQKEFGTFDGYLHSFTQSKVFQNKTGEVMTTSPLSDALSRDLRKRGMKFMGSVTVYSYLQAIGIVDDHEPGCFKSALRK